MTLGAKTYLEKLISDGKFYDCYSVIVNWKVRSYSCFIVNWMVRS
jgi:hypothetical protein